MTLIASLVSLIAALIALITYLYQKNHNQAIIDNNDAVKAQLNANNQQITADLAAIEAEKQKQQQIQASISQVDKGTVSQQQLDDFFNKNGNNGSNN